MQLAHLEWIKDECLDVAPPCAFELVHGLGCSNTCDDDKSFLLKGEDERKRDWIVATEHD